MDINNLEIFVTFLVTSLMLGIAFKFAYNARNARHCQEIYDDSYEILSDFYTSANKVVSDPATPVKLKSALTDMAILLTDDDTGKLVFNSVIKELEGDDKKGKSPELATELENLQSSRPDLYKDGVKAMNSGTMAFILIYGQEHPQVKIRAYRMVSNPGKSASFISQVDSAFGKIRNDTHDLDGGLAPA